MPRDHYIAETYLKHFVGNDGMLHVYRKSNGEYFPSRPRAICHEWDGDRIHDFLSDPKFLAKYRKVFEPAWNPALGELKAGRVSPTEKFAISGYWANLLVFTPAQRRLDMKSHDHQVVEFLRARDAVDTERGEPDAMLREILSTLDTGALRIETKPEAMRAMQAMHLKHYTWALYNTNWVILKKLHRHRPSDERQPSFL